MSYGRQQPNGVPRFSFSAGRHTSHPAAAAGAHARQR